MEAGAWRFESRLRLGAYLYAIRGKMQIQRELMVCGQKIEGKGYVCAMVLLDSNLKALEHAERGVYINSIFGRLGKDAEYFRNLMGASLTNNKDTLDNKPAVISTTTDGFFLFLKCIKVKNRQKEAVEKADMHSSDLLRERIRYANPSDIPAEHVYYLGVFVKSIDDKKRLEKYVGMAAEKLKETLEKI